MSKLMELIPKTEFTVVLPVSGKTIKVTPYKHGQVQGVLRASNQLKDMKEGQTKKIFGIMESLVDSCIVTYSDDEKIRCRELQNADFVYLMVYLNSISSGEVEEVFFRCKHECDVANKLQLTLEGCVIENKENTNNLVELKLGDKEVVLHMKEYTFDVMLKNSTIFDKESEIDKDITKFYASFFEAVEVKDGSMPIMDNLKMNEKISFLEALNEKDLKPIMDYIQSRPKLVWKSKFICEKCNSENEAVIDNVVNFFV